MQPDREPLVRCRNVSFRYPDAATAVLNDVSLEIQPGRCYCLTGPTGSGKTTLARILAGLGPEGDCAGDIRFAPVAERAAIPAGLVLQDPDVQLLASTVGAEAAFGLENLAVEPAAMPQRVAAALASVGLEKPLDFPVAAMSMGQKYRLLAAALLVMQPGLLILDEPGAQLDPAGLLQLRDVLQELKKKDIAIVLCEHRPEPLLELIDEFWQLSSRGSLSAGLWTAPAHAVPCPDRPAAAQSGPTLLKADRLCFQDLQDEPVWEDVTFTLRHGERIAIAGLNGTGKTTLLRCLAGFLSAHAGSIEILGGVPEPSRLRGRLGLLFQNPEKQLFENTVIEEVSFPLRRFGLNRAAAAERARSALEQCAIADLANASPHTLSYGQKHLVALASVLAPRPEVLLLDDPLAGLDAERSRDVLYLLSRWSERYGTALLCTSHEPGAGFGWAHRVLHLEGGRLVEA